MDDRSLLRLRGTVDGEASTIAVHVDRLDWTIPIDTIRAVTVRKRRGRTVVSVQAYGNTLRIRTTSSQAQEVKLLLQALVAGRHPAQAGAAPPPPPSPALDLPDRRFLRLAWPRRGGGRR